MLFERCPHPLLANRRNVSHTDPAFPPVFAESEDSVRSSGPVPRVVNRALSFFYFDLKTLSRSCLALCRNRSRPRYRFQRLSRRCYMIERLFVVALMTFCHGRAAVFKDRRLLNVA